MTSQTPSRLRVRDWGRREFARGRAFAFGGFLALLLIPIVGHGCHGDDVDHEPAVAPPEHRPENRR